MTEYGGNIVTHSPRGSERNNCLKYKAAVCF